MPRDRPQSETLRCDSVQEKLDHPAGHFPPDFRPRLLLTLSSTESFVDELANEPVHERGECEAEVFDVALLERPLFLRLAERLSQRFESVLPSSLR